MTNQEASRILDGLKPNTAIAQGNETAYDIGQALSMAINALEQEPSGDLISRQELLEDLYKRDYTKFTHRDFVALVQYQDTVQQEPKTGHWNVVSDVYGDSAYICECSECKDTVWVYKDADRKWNYCPNCGARMVKPQESEIHCTCADEEIAKSFIEDVEAVKDLLPQKSEK
jgi:ribosomal protein S27E